MLYDVCVFHLPAMVIVSCSRISHNNTIIFTCMCTFVVCLCEIYLVLHWCVTFSPVSEHVPRTCSLTSWWANMSPGHVRSPVCHGALGTWEVHFARNSSCVHAFELATPMFCMRVVNICVWIHCFWLGLVIAQQAQCIQIPSKGSLINTARTPIAEAIWGIYLYIL